MDITKLKITGNLKLLFGIYLSVLIVLIFLGIMFVTLTTDSVNKYSDIAEISTQKLSLLIGIRKKC